MSGRIVHFEIPFDDGDRAREFYREAFGWTIAPVPEMDYTMVMSGPTGEEGGPTEPGFINGGMFERRVGSPATSPVITVDVDNIDAALEKIEKLGGATLVARQAVGDMGFVAYFKDTEGNVLGMWESIG